MTSRYMYTRLNTEDSTPRHEPSHEDLDSSSTKLRRMQVSRKKERWPGAASHLSSHYPIDAQKHYIEHIIKPEETLQGVALLYRCSVFELKVSNNIQKESEFFARRSLKVPVRQHSSLIEKAANSLVTVSDQDTQASPSQSPNSSTEYLKQLDEDLQRLKEKARVYDIDSLSPASSVITEHVLKRRTHRSDCHGDDCGLSWAHIFGLALLVLLACPLLYFLYLELNLHKLASSHNHTAIVTHENDSLGKRVSQLLVLGNDSISNNDS